MRRRTFIVLATSAVMTFPHCAWSKGGEKIYRIGVFTAAGAGVGEKGRSDLIDAFRELGWTEGKNIAFEWKDAEGQLDRLPELAAELVRDQVDVIIGVGTLAPLAAKRATSSIPIVMAPAGDPVGTGLVASLAHPGGNVTGLSLMASDLGGKRLEILREALPSLTRAAILWNAANQYSALVVKATVSAATTLGIRLQLIEVREPQDFDTAFAGVLREAPEALITVEDPLTFSHRKRIVDFTSDRHLPAIHGLKEFAEDGGLMAYGANINDLFRRSAGYVDKILKGAKPADLPVEQPTKFELVINLKAAKVLGLTIPPSLLVRADEVIE